MARPPKLRDPVEGSEIEMAEEMAALEQEVLSIEQLTPGAVMPSAARVTDPFINYPFKWIPLVDAKGRAPKDRAGTPVLVNGKAPQVCVSHIVLHNHLADRIVQDPSNRGKRINYHSRGIRDEVERINVDIVFDRPFKTAKGIFYGAIVPSHNLRAQLIFNYNTKAADPRVEVDKRYLLLDTDQVSRLRTVFYQIVNPKMRQEQQASFITGETTTDPGEVSLGSEE